MTGSDILIVSPAPSAPQTSGNRKRIDQLASQLTSRGHRIHFLLYNVFANDSLVNQTSEAEMRSKWASYSHLMADVNNQPASIRLRRNLLKSRVYRELAIRGLRIPVRFGIDDWCCDDLLQEVRNRMEQHSYAAVMVEYAYLSRALTVVPDNVVKILDTHDVFTDRHQKLIKSGVKPGFFTTSLDDETRGLNRANVVLAIQECENEWFRRIVQPDVNVLTVAHVEPARYVQRDYAGMKSIGLVGSGNDINVASTQRFCDAIWARQDLRDLEVRVAGAVCKRLKKVPPNVNLLGYVDSLDDFYADVDVIVNPMMAGTGLKIKSVEAISYGVPFVSTSVGTDGISISAAYHSLPTLEALIEHLRKVRAEDHDLNLYRDASVACHQEFVASVASQVDSLDSAVRQRTGHQQPRHDYCEAKVE